MEKKPLKSTEYAKFIKDEWEQEFMKKLNGLDEVAALLFAAEFFEGRYTHLLCSEKQCCN